MLGLASKEIVLFLDSLAVSVPEFRLLYYHKKAILETIDHLRKRVVFGKPLITKQVLRHRLVDWLTEIECIKQLTYHIVRMKMKGMDVTREVSMGKLFGAKLLNKVMDGCLQMFGGLGYMSEMPISRAFRAFRDSRLFSIGGGANEVMSEIYVLSCCYTAFEGTGAWIECSGYFPEMSR